MEIRPINPTIGAEITGVDLRNIRENERLEIEKALLRHGVVFFRDQDLTPEEHIDFGRLFGKLHIHPYLPKEDKHPEIYKIETATDRPSHERYYNMQWHSDVTCDAEPPMGAILLLREIPENGGGDTCWCNTYAAFETLSDDMKVFLSGLTAEHGTAVFYQTEETGGKAGQVAERSIHPVVRTHPVTGRQALYVNSIFTKRIVELEPIESDYLLQMLYRHIENPRFHCRFTWQPGSVAFWDNRCTQHRAISDYVGHRRYGQRVTLCGDRPFYRSETELAEAAE